MADEKKVRRQVWIEHSADIDLSKSHKSEDGYSPILHHKGKRGAHEQVEIFLTPGAEESAPVRTPTRPSPRPEARRRQLTTEQQNLIMDLVELATQKALDRFEVWFTQWLANAPARKAEKARKRREAAHRAATATSRKPSLPSGAEIDESSSVAAPVADIRVLSMAAAEWQSVLGALLLTRPMNAQLWQMLAQARIEDADETVLTQQRQMAKLTPQEFEDHVARLLEADPGLADEPLSTLLVRLAELPSTSQSSAVSAEKPKKAKKLLPQGSTSPRCTTG